MAFFFLRPPARTAPPSAPPPPGGTTKFGATDAAVCARHDGAGRLQLFEVTKVVTYNLNKVIDRNYYPVPEARNSNMRHRPVGLGVQGLADAFIMVRDMHARARALAPFGARRRLG